MPEKLRLLLIDILTILLIIRFINNKFTKAIICCVLLNFNDLIQFKTISLV